MKIRIAVAVSPDGTWSANGWGGPGSNAKDADKMGIAVDGVGENESRYWVEVEIPEPQPIPTITDATVTQA